MSDEFEQTDAIHAERERDHSRTNRGGRKHADGFQRCGTAALSAVVPLVAVLTLFTITLLAVGTVTTAVRSTAGVAPLRSTDRHAADRSIPAPAVQTAAPVHGVPPTLALAFAGATAIGSSVVLLGIAAILLGVRALAHRDARDDLARLLRGTGSQLEQAARALETRSETREFEP